MFLDHDGRIHVGNFRCTRDQFQAIEPGYSGLPDEVSYRRYDPNAAAGKPKHVVHTDRGDQRGGPDPWPEGDAILARESEYPALLEAAFPPPPPPKPLTAAEAIDARVQNDPVVKALVAEIADMRGQTETEVIGRLKTRAATPKAT